MRSIVWIAAVVLAATAAAVVLSRGPWSRSPTTPPATPPAASRPAGLQQWPADETFVLRDLAGNRRRLEELQPAPACVLLFLSCECPVSNRYAPRLAELARQFEPRGVRFLALYPQRGDTLDRIASHGLEYDLPFALWRDGGARLARRLGVERVPTAVVLDRDQAVAYRGRISDQFAAGVSRREATREDLAIALDEVLAGQRVAQPTTPVDGCLIDGTQPAGERAAAVAFDDVAAIIGQHCTGCHRPQGSAPFGLAEPSAVIEHAAMIREVVAERRMPPWHADDRGAALANRRRLSDPQVQTIVRWIDQGCPKSSPTPEIPLVAPTAAAASTVRLNTAPPIEIPATGALDYVYRTVEPSDTDSIFAEGQWLKGGRVRTAAPEVAHHLVAFLVRPGTGLPPDDYRGVAAIVAWAPGEMGFELPDGYAIWIPEGTRVVFEGHYTPGGKAAVDTPTVELELSRQPPRRQTYIAIQNHSRLRIPPGAAHARAEMVSRFPAGGEILALFPHLHLRGKAVRCMWLEPDGRREPLLSVPRYDFYWQTIYWFEQPVAVEPGSRLLSEAWWDNSRLNLRNPDPAVEVVFGPQSPQEMFTLWIVYADTGQSPFATSIAPPVVQESLDGESS